MKASLTLRGYLSHMQSLIRKRAVLVGEYVLHPDNPDGKPPAHVMSTNKAMEEEWVKLQRDLKKVLGVDLCPFGRLVNDPSFDMNAGWEHGAPDPYRITMGALQKKANKARVKDPSITLLKSMVFEPEQES